MLTPAINGKTRIAGLIGNPVSHSLSPAIHNHAFAKCGLPFVYLPLHVRDSEALPNVVTSLCDLSFVGANVTIPYKSEALKICDEIRGLSLLTGTVNTLYFDKGKLCGTTTDYLGFKRALECDAVALAGRRVVIIGTGGTARTLALALTDDAGREGIPEVVISGRRMEAVDEIVQMMDERLPEVRCAVTKASFSSLTKEWLDSTPTIIVNCTSAGMQPQADSSPIDPAIIPQSCYLFDMIYNPIETRLLREFRKNGGRGQNGLRMLLAQGLASFELWTGVKVDMAEYNLDELAALIG